MDILVGLLTLVALTGFVWGVWKLLRKGQRRRGLIYVAASFCAVMVGGTLAGIQLDRDARAAGFASHEEQEKAEAAEQARRATELALARQAEQAAEQERLDALAREQGYDSHAAQQAAELATQRAAEQAERERLAQERAEQEVVERAAQEAAEAAAQTEEEARQARLASKTTSMAEQIAALVPSYYGIEATPLIPNTPLCRDDGYCDFNVGVFRVQVYGAGLVVVEATNQASMTDYVELCAVALAAISGSEMSYAVEAVGLVYGAALSSGSAERDFSGVEVKFTPDLGGDLGCRLFKY